MATSYIDRLFAKVSPTKQKDPEQEQNEAKLKEESEFGKKDTVKVDKLQLENISKANNDKRGSMSDQQSNRTLTDRKDKIEDHDLKG